MASKEERGSPEDNLPVRLARMHGDTAKREDPIARTIATPNPTATL